MKTNHERDAKMAKMLKQVGELVEQFRKDTHTTYEILTDDTCMHYRTYRKLATGDPKQRAVFLLLCMAELMQRDSSRGQVHTEHFFNDLRHLLANFPF